MKIAHVMKEKIFLYVNEKKNTQIKQLGKQKVTILKIF